MEDLSNHTPFCVRNRVRDVLKRRPGLIEAALQLHADLYNTGEIVRARGEQMMANVIKPVS